MEYNIAYDKTENESRIYVVNEQAPPFSLMQSECKICDGSKEVGRPGNIRTEGNMIEVDGGILISFSRRPVEFHLIHWERNCRLNDHGLMSCLCSRRHASAFSLWP